MSDFCRGTRGCDNPRAQTDDRHVYPKRGRLAGSSGGQRASAF